MLRSATTFAAAIALSFSVSFPAPAAEQFEEGALREIIPGHYRYENGSRVAGVIETDDGVIVIDGLSPVAMGEDVRAKIAETIGKPVRYLINSTFHDNYTQGNIAYPDVIKIGHTLYRDDLLDMLLEDGVSAEEQALRMPDLTYEESMTLHLGGKEIRILHNGPAHTRGDSIVFVPEDRIVYVSELLFYDRFPWMNSGYVAWIDAIDRALALDADIFVPGQGPMSYDDPQESRQALIDMRQVFVDARDAVQREIDRGATEDEVVQAVMLQQYANLGGYDQQREVVVRRTYQDLKGTLE